MSKDEIYSQGSVDRDFVFDGSVAEVFDNMLLRSVPFYKEVIGMIGTVLRDFLQDNDTVYDLGSSTGTTLLFLAEKLNDLSLSYVGCDSSSAMIEKARKKASMFSASESVRFEEADIQSFSFSGAGAVLLNYTLQFLRPLMRENFLKKICESLRSGGVLILSEKIISHDSIINRKFIDFYYEFKKAQGYSALEISNKREALENVLIPFSIDENIAMLRAAGFEHVEPFFQWFNFCSFIAIK